MKIILFFVILVLLGHWTPTNASELNYGTVVCEDSSPGHDGSIKVRIAPTILGGKGLEATVSRQLGDTMVELGRVYVYGFDYHQHPFLYLDPVHFYDANPRSFGLWIQKNGKSDGSHPAYLEARFPSSIIMDPRLTCGCDISETTPGLVGTCRDWMK